jgi:hypothetical protein
MKLELEFRKEILHTFAKERIICLLYFGTRAFVGANNCSDYDFMFILNKYESADIFKLREVIQQSKFKSIDFNINLLYLTDIKSRGKENFQIRSVQSSFYKYLENSIVLLGKNIFKQNSLEISSSRLQDLMDFKIQEYYGRCDKLFLQNINDETLYNHVRKYTKDIVRFILIREEIISLEDVTKSRWETIFDLAIKNHVFSKPITNRFSDLMENYKDKNNIKKIEYVRRGIYEKYLKLFSKRVSRRT